MRLACYFVFVINMLLSLSAQAAQVTTWGSSENAVENKVVGKWQLVAIYEGSTNISADTALKDYWIFKSNGWVEHYEEPFGLRRSSYWVKGRRLAVKDRSGKNTRVFHITYVDREKLIWKYREEGRTFTYNFARY